MSFAVVATAFVLGKLHAMTRGFYDFSESRAFIGACIFGLTATAAAFAFGIPERPAFDTPLKSAVVAASLPPLGFAIFQTMLGSLLLPRSVLFLSALINVIIYISFEKLSYHSTKFIPRRDTVVLLSDFSDAELLSKASEIHAEIPFTLLDRKSFSDADSKDSIVDSLRASNPGTIVFRSKEDLNEPLLNALFELHSDGIRVRSLSQFYEEYLGKMLIEGIGEVDLLSDISEVHYSLYYRVSRFLDLIAGLCGLCILVLVTPLVTIGNHFGNKGKLIYSQDRVGLNGATFKILKFRSMREDDGPTTWTSESDPRVTPFGRLLRLTHIDEIPQALNMIKGELSIVGPRPEQPLYVEVLRERLPFYDARNLVKPGLTGWAQVNYPYGANEVDAFEKLQFDLWYLRHQSVSLDLKILARTVRHVFGLKGR